MCDYYRQFVFPLSLCTTHIIVYGYQETFRNYSLVLLSENKLITYIWMFNKTVLFFLKSEKENLLSQKKGMWEQWQNWADYRTMQHKNNKPNDSTVQTHLSKLKYHLCVWWENVTRDYSYIKSVTHLFPSFVLMDIIS